MGMPSIQGAPSFWSMPPWQDTQGAMPRSGAPTRTSALALLAVAGDAALNAGVHRVQTLAATPPPA